MILLLYAVLPVLSTRANSTMPNKRTYTTRMIEYYCCVRHYCTDCTIKTQQMCDYYHCTDGVAAVTAACVCCTVLYDRKTVLYCTLLLAGGDKQRDVTGTAL